MSWTRMSHGGRTGRRAVASFIRNSAWRGSLVLIGIWLVTTPAIAQVGREPQKPEVSRGVYPSLLPHAAEPQELVVPPPGTLLDKDGQGLWEPSQEFSLEMPGPGPAAWRRLVRKSSFGGAWLAGGDDGDLGITELKASTTVIVPVPLLDSPLMVSPNFGATFLDGPVGMCIPDEVYRASANVMWTKQRSDRLSLMIGVTPGVSSDFEATDGAIRIFGYGAAKYQWKPTTQLMFGVAYLDRADITVLPMAGLIWTPNEDTRLDLTFPKPRLAKRIHWDGSWAPGAEHWVYLASELGGGTYAVRRPAGFDDEMTLRDFRVVLGIERKTDCGLGGHAEIGYVFGREIEFERDITEFQPSDTVLLRVGVSY